jgi:hypothetical protein
VVDTSFDDMEVSVKRNAYGYVRLGAVLSGDFPL